MSKFNKRDIVHVKGFGGLKFEVEGRVRTSTGKEIDSYRLLLAEAHNNAIVHAWASDITPALPEEPELGATVARNPDGQQSVFIHVQAGFDSKEPGRHWFRINRPTYLPGGVKLRKRWFTWAELNKKES